jgi:hypothetical protein
MNSETKKNLTEQGTWKRIAYMVMFVITFNVAEMVLFAVVVLQVAFKLFTGKPLDPLKELGQEIGVYLRSVVDFLSYSTEEMPFPVASWPGSASKPGNSGPVSTEV